MRSICTGVSFSLSGTTLFALATATAILLTLKSTSALFLLMIFNLCSPALLI